MATARHIGFGIDFFLQHARQYQKEKIGFVTNDAAKTAQLKSSRLAMMEAGLSIVRLFSPEHGINAAGEDGSYQAHQTDKLTGLPIVSLYGDKLLPDENDIKDIDVLVFDLPDAGCRFYTYQWTLSYIMEACSRYNKPLIVLDRPNPISGILSLAEGPMLDEMNCRSFIGRWNIPLRHSLTMGELAAYWNKTRAFHIDLTVMPVQGWSRNLFFDDLAVPFVPPSPGIPDFETALVYPGMGLLEGINVSEGRGTNSPFKICGAPWINAEKFCTSLNHLQLPGFIATPVEFIPDTGKYQHLKCLGARITITDKFIFRPVLTGMSLINLLMNLYPEKIEPHLYKTVANPSGENHLDKLTGINKSWNVLQQPVKHFQSIINHYTHDNNWTDKIKPFLLYQY